MKRTTFLSALLLLTACNGQDPPPAPVDPIDPPAPTEPSEPQTPDTPDSPPDTPVPPPDTPPEPPITEASVRFQEAGAPILGLAVYVSDADGNHLETLITDEDGAVILESVPEDGLTITFPTWVLHDSREGLSTIKDVAAGADMLIGRAAPEPSVAFTIDMPVAFEGADRYMIRAGCSSRVTSQPAAVQPLTIPARCVTEGTVPVAAFAVDTSGAPIAYVAESEVYVNDSDPNDPTIDIDWSMQNWSTAFATQSLELTNMPFTGGLFVQTRTPDRRQPVAHVAEGVGVQEGNDHTFAFNLLAGLSPRMETEIGAFANIDGENVMNRLWLGLPAPAAGQSSLVELNLAEAVPSPVRGITASPDLRTLAMAQPGTHNCHGEVVVPDASIYTLRATPAAGGVAAWEVLAPGATDVLFHFPELPPEAAEHWNPAQLGDVRAEVISISHSTRGYGDWLTAADPFNQAQFPDVFAGEHACTALVNTPEL